MSQGALLVLGLVLTGLALAALLGWSYREIRRVGIQEPGGDEGGSSYRRLWPEPGEARDEDELSESDER